ncbi:MAG: vWA domain-containing protein [Pseudomonadota bacterium]
MNMFEKVEIFQTEANTYEKEIAIRNALQEFADIEGRYPCPASLIAPFDSAAFGVEPVDGNIAGDADGDGLDDDGYQCEGANIIGDGSDGIFPINGRGGANVRVGAVPVRTLNLPDEYIYDEYDTRFVYALTEVYGNDGAIEGGMGGAITIEDSNGNDITESPGTAIFALITPKGDPNGSFHSGGAQNAVCDANGTASARNCDFLNGGTAEYETTVTKSDSNNNYFMQSIQFSASNCTADGGTDDFADITFIIDSSGSMNSNINSDFCPSELGAQCNRIEMARWAMRRIVPQVIAKDYATREGTDPVDRVNITRFVQQGRFDHNNLMSGAMDNMEFDVSSQFDDVDLGPESEEDFDAILAGVEDRLDFCPGGNTPLGQHIEAATQLTNNQTNTRPNKIIVLSDGYHNGGANYNVNTVRDRLQDAGNDLTNTIVDIIDMSGVHTALNQGVANGGSFYSVNDSQGLLDAFAQATNTCASLPLNIVDDPGTCGNPN